MGAQGRVLIEREYAIAPQVERLLVALRSAGWTRDPQADHRRGGERGRVGRRRDPLAVLAVAIRVTTWGAGAVPPERPGRDERCPSPPQVPHHADPDRVRTPWPPTPSASPASAAGCGARARRAPPSGTCCGATREPGRPLGPLLEGYLDRYSPEQRRRHEVKPGVTASPRSRPQRPGPGTSSSASTSGTSTTARSPPRPVDPRPHGQRGVQRQGASSQEAATCDRVPRLIPLPRIWRQRRPPGGRRDARTSEDGGGGGDQRSAGWQGGPGRR